MEAKKIILTVSNNLESDQRVNKMACSLKKMGFRVMVMGCKSRPCHYYRTGYATKRIDVIFKKGFLFYLELNIRFFFILLFSRYDIFVSNDTDTIIPNLLASKLRNKPWVADLHELFPEVPEVTNRKFVKWFWTKIEDLTFPHIKYGYTVCQSIADYYEKRYNIKLDVVRNIPNHRHYDGRQRMFGDERRKIILYQGAVNVGRGIEWIMDAMPFVDNAKFVIIGKGDMYDKLIEKSKDPIFKDRVQFIGHVPYAELYKYTLSSDLGVCLLKNQGLSYYYSLPNRIFDFMHAHVPILATDFPEIRKVIDSTNTGFLINTEDPRSIADAINRILNADIDHDEYSKACDEYCWENEEKKLVQIYSSLLSYEENTNG